MGQYRYGVKAYAPSPQAIFNDICGYVHRVPVNRNGLSDRKQKHPKKIFEKENIDKLVRQCHDRNRISDI